MLTCFACGPHTCIGHKRIPSKSLHVGEGVLGKEAILHVVFFHDGFIPVLPWTQQQRRDSHNYWVTSSHAVNHSTGYILTLISNKHMWPFITTFEGNGNIISIYIQCSDTWSSFQQPPMTVTMFCSILLPSRPKDSNLAPLNSLKWSSSILPRGQHFTNRASKNPKHKILVSQHFQTKPNWAAFFEGLHLPWGLALQLQVPIPGQLQESPDFLKKHWGNKPWHWGNESPRLTDATKNWTLWMLWMCADTPTIF